MIEYSGGKILLDSGPGTIEKLRRRDVNPNSIGKILITHLHIDHVLDLPAMIKIRLFDEFGRPMQNPPKLEVYGPSGLKEFLDKMIHHGGAYSYLSEMMKHSNYLYTYEVEDGSVVESSSLKIYSSSVEHYNSVAYRFEVDGLSLAYSGDTVYDERMINLAKDVDILIHECSFPKEMLLGKHTSDEELVDIVKKSRPKLLLVTHLYPAWEGRERPLEDKLRRETGCRVYVVKDMDIIEVEP